MNVAELIEALRDAPQDHEVWVYVDGQYGPFSTRDLYVWPAEPGKDVPTLLIDLGGQALPVGAAPLIPEDLE